MKKYVYQWTRRHPCDPQVAGEIVQRCRSDQALLEEAAHASSPLHGCFDWDNTVAGDSWRLQQARTLKNSLQVRIVNVKGKVEHITAFISKLDKSGYVPVLEASDAELTAAEQRCWREAQRFRARFKALQFARPIIAAIDQQALRVERKGDKKRKRG